MCGPAPINRKLAPSNPRRMLSTPSLECACWLWLHGEERACWRGWLCWRGWSCWRRRSCLLMDVSSSVVSKYRARARGSTSPVTYFKSISIGSLLLCRPRSLYTFCPFHRKPWEILPIVSPAIPSVLSRKNPHPPGVAQGKSRTTCK